MSVPDVMDIKKEPESIIKLLWGGFSGTRHLCRQIVYKPKACGKWGSIYTVCTIKGWDQHGNLPNEMAGQAKDVDQASAALILDLKQRGMLEDTLVIWGGEFWKDQLLSREF